MKSRCEVDNDGRSDRRQLLFELGGGDDVDLPRTVTMSVVPMWSI